MTTNFFQNIASLNLQGVWKLVITTDDQGNFIVSQLFNTTCGDKAVNLIVPLTLSGTAEELDEGFFGKVTEPTIKSAGLQVNMEAHLKSVEQAKAASKLEQDKKNKEKAQATATATKQADNVEVPEPKSSKEDKKNTRYTERIKDWQADGGGKKSERYKNSPRNSPLKSRKYTLWIGRKVDGRKK